LAGLHCSVACDRGFGRNRDYIAIALGTASSWHSAIPAAGDLKATPATDNYVEGLAKLGIAKLPTYEPAGVLHSGSRGGALPMTQLARGCVLLG
jgi:hypothetical protein